jgi:hypothetical protein
LTATTVPTGNAPVEWKETRRDGRAYYVLTDPRAKFLYGYINSQGAAYSKLDGGFVFPGTMKEDFQSIVARLQTRPLLKVENEKGAARYAHEELTELGCAYVAVKRFANNPNSPTDYEYYAPDEQTLVSANSTVFEKSRATPEQVTRIQQALAAGVLTFDKIKQTPREIDEAIKNHQLSQADARSLLHHVEPPTDAVVGKIKELATSGQLSDYVLRRLVEDGHKLTHEQATLGVSGIIEALDETILAQKNNTLDPNGLPFNLRNCYDIEQAGRKMATIDQQRQVRAFEEADMLRGVGTIDYEKLTRAQANNFITSGKAYAVAGSRFDEIYHELNREGWSAAGSNSAYKGGTERNVAEGTAQGGAQKSQERIREMLNGEMTAPWPDRGFVAGRVIHADRYNVLIEGDTGTKYLADRDAFARFEENTDPQDFEGAYIGFVMNRRGAFGIGFRSADCAAAAEALLDAQQFKRASNVPFREGDPPNRPIDATVSAVRHGYAAIDLPNGETIAVPKSTLSNATPTFGETVTFTPPGLGESVTLGAADEAVPRRGRTR